MPHLFTGNALWHLISQSDAISKAVLLVLLVLSIISWAIFIYKLLELRALKYDLEHMSKALDSVSSIDDIVTLSTRAHHTVGGFFLQRNLLFLKSLLENAKHSMRSGLLADERELLREYTYQVIDEILAQKESYLSFLSATAAISPLLGLFGTVWGLVHAFISISQKQTADIATVAPGIAEALITTLAGLMVAIPALVMFVYLSSYIKTIEQLCMKLSDRFMFTTYKVT